MHRTKVIPTMIVTLFLISLGCGRLQNKSTDSKDNGVLTSTESKIVEESAGTANSNNNIEMNGISQFRFISKCDSIAPEKCKGFYGISISTNGTYQIGPGPEGQIIQGEIDESDFASLKALKENFILNRVDNLSEVCVNVDSADFDLSVEVVNQSGVEATVHQSGKRLCYRGLSKSDAQSLPLRMKGLSDKYYPSLFPSHCTSAVHALKHFYLYLSACQYDSECSYLDRDFLPITSSRVTEIAELNECKLLPPLRVANTFLAMSLQRELMEKWQITQELCNDESRIPTCRQRSEEHKIKVFPACVEGLCTLSRY